MKSYKLKILTFFLIFLFITLKVNSCILEMPLLNKVIYIDPGHGGIDPGTYHKNIYEKDINLEISKILQASLEQKGASVRLTREDDYDLAIPHAYLRKRSDLSQRVSLINNSKCDLYLSIHLNASQSTSWRGAQVFYNNINDKNKELAEVIQESFRKYLGSKRKIKEINNLFMYRYVKQPGLLLEVGFLSNPNERYLLRKKYYQKKIVKAITNGVLDYFNKKL